MEFTNTNWSQIYQKQCKYISCPLNFIQMISIYWKPHPSPQILQRASIPVQSTYVRNIRRRSRLAGIRACGRSKTGSYLASRSIKGKFVCTACGNRFTLRIVEFGSRQKAPPSYLSRTFLWRQVVQMIMTNYKPVWYVENGKIRSQLHYLLKDRSELLICERIFYSE